MLRTKTAPISRPYFSALVFACALIIIAATTSLAQSGRRTQKRGAAPPPPPPASTQPPSSAETSEPAQPPRRQSRPAQPQISLLLVSDATSTIYLSFPFAERMKTWVAKRLRDSDALAVMEGDRSDRKEAIKRAKASTEAFVIWVQLDESAFRPSTGSQTLDEARINYSIYSPVTGKAKSSGVVYLNSTQPTIGGIGVGRIGLPCYPDVRNSRDYALLKASLEVAERIMSVFNAPRPPVCP